MEERIAQLERELAELKSLYFKDNFEAKQLFIKDCDFRGNVDLRTTTSSTFKVTPDGKVGFFGATPVTQYTNISSPSGGATVDSQARTAIDSIIGMLDSYGLTQ